MKNKRTISRRKEDTSLLELEEKVLFLENEMKTLKESYSKPKVTKIKRKK